MPKMRWDKAALEKLKKEAALYEQSAFFIKEFGLRGILERACTNILNVVDELDDIISLSYSVVNDYDKLIDEKRAKVEKELIYIIDKSYDRTDIKQAFEEFLVHFKQGDLKNYGIYAEYSPIDTIPAATGKGKKNGKSPQLTKFEPQQQEDHDDGKLKVYSERSEKLNKESDDYTKTLLFMESFLYKLQHPNEEQRKLLLYAYKNVLAADRDLQCAIALSQEQRDLLLCAYNNVLAVDCDLQFIIVTGKRLSDQEIVSEYRSKIEKEIQGICDNVSDLTVKKAYTRHLDDFKTGFKLSAQDHHSQLQNEDGEILLSEPKMGVKKKKKTKKKKKKSKLLGKGWSKGRSKDRSGICKTPSEIDLYLQMIKCRDMTRDHSECCEKKTHLETSYLNLDYMDDPLEEEEYPEYVACDFIDDL